MFRPTPLNPEYVLRASLLHFTGIKIAASETKKLPSFLTIGEPPILQISKKKKRRGELVSILLFFCFRKCARLKQPRKEV